MSLVGELVRSGQHNNLMSILLEEWEKFTVEIDLITRDQGDLLDMWLSATEGDEDEKLAKLAHWPETELVKDMKAEETILLGLGS